MPVLHFRQVGSGKSDVGHMAREIKAATRDSYPQNYVPAAVMLFKINIGNQPIETRALTTKWKPDRCRCALAGL